MEDSVVYQASVQAVPQAPEGGNVPQEGLVVGNARDQKEHLKNFFMGEGSRAFQWDRALGV